VQEDFSRDPSNLEKKERNNNHAVFFIMISPDFENTKLVPQ